MASFDVVNYTIRPNKNIERKLVFESLRELSTPLGLGDYRYIGLGSPWFIDFLLAHRYLLIRDMICIEFEEHAPRMEFNKPYDCIAVHQGPTSEVFPKLDLASRSSVIWLDYDTGPEGPVLEDVEFIVNHAKAGTILLITLNAHRDRLPSKDSDGRIFENKEQAIRFQFKELAPATLPVGATNVEGYPKLLSQILFTHAHRSVHRSGKGYKFLSMFNFYYKDGAPMITIGGLLSDDSHEQTYRASEMKKFEWVTGEEQFAILAPPLTVKEKLTLDRLLPRATPPTSVEIGFTLSETQLSAYHKLYRLYPLFVEFQV